MGTGSSAAAALALGSLVPFLLLLLPYPPSILAQGDWGGGGPPGFSPNFPLNFDFCKKFTCGRGSCNSTYSRTNSSYSYSYNYSYSSNGNASGYGCNCQDGWRTFSTDGQYPYLPCVIPKCEFSSSCSQTFMSQKPKALPTFPNNFTMATDPCSWAICGEGTCKNTSTFSYICECKSGYQNMLNISNLPCFRNCEGGVGKSCEELGIGKLSASQSPSGSSSSESPGVVTIAPMSLPVSLIIVMASLLALA